MPVFFDNALNSLQADIQFFIFLSAILGLLFGSFLNVVIHRLPKMMEREWQQNCRDFLKQSNNEPLVDDEQPRYNLVIPRSACPSCGHQISAIENIPVISYLFLQGKCKKCDVPISARYPFVELLTGILFAGISYKLGATGLTFACWILILALVALTFIDIDTQLLPDDITLPLVWIGLLVNMEHGLIDKGFCDLNSAVIGAVAGYLALWSIYWLFKLVTGKEGMGYGDFKLLAAIGAWFGWQLLPAVILLSSIAGTIVGISLIIFARHGRETPIPFGPYLAMGGIAALFWGPRLSQIYLGA
jgi:leader peptidase (prepilin peptidase) / N-methyltransferase